MTSLRAQLEDVQDVGRRTELQLLQELDMLHDKNSVLSNLLDIIQERADAAEQELEKHLQEHSAPSTRSASAVSQVSALSDASCGSDEVFLTPPAGAPAEKGQIIHRDWEAKLKNRIESLERLLAEERQKVSTAEKKLHLSAEHGLAPSLSDDVKLRLREKELLQEELLENQRHLRVATDQIQGMRERLHALEDEHHRLRADYRQLCIELDKRDLDSENTAEDSDKTPENSVEPEGSLVALRAAGLTMAATPSATKTDDPSSRTDPARDVTTGGVATSSDDVRMLRAEVARYKLMAEQLEYKVEEITDVWRSKSAATEKEKDVVENQLRERSLEISKMNDTLETFRQELKKQSVALGRAEEKVCAHEEEVRRRQAAEQELHDLLTHATQRELSLKQLREAVATRDDRLKEKDDIIHYLNFQLEKRQSETQQLQLRVDDMTSQASPPHVTSPKDAIAGKEVGQTDVEKENARLREKARSLGMEVEQGDATRKELENSRRQLEQRSLGQVRERAELQAALNVAEEKLRLYETLSSTSSDKALENIKKESLKYFSEKEALAAEVTLLKQELSVNQQTASDTAARLKQEVHSKLLQLKEETEANKRLLPELDRLRSQAERAYRLQQEQRLLRAEHQAMKIRYETRVDKMTQEHSKMMSTMETLQKEKASDRELVDGVQKALTLMRDAYTQDQVRWEEEKDKLDRQIKELSETREVVGELQKRTVQLKEELSHQERCRVDLVNKFTTDRAAWDINKAALQGRINQLEEQVQRSRKEAGSSGALETAWCQERANQQRLLSQAHGLALDLQSQLAARTQEAEESQRHLAAQMEKERLLWERERREKEKRLAELESRIQWQGSLQRRVMEIQDYAEREVQQARKERAEMTKRLVETRQQQSRDARALDDILTGLVRLRELGSTLTSEEVKPQTSGTGLSDFDRDLLKYVKEAMVQISKAADKLTRFGSSGSGRIRRSLSSSELELLREELNDLRQEGDDRFPVLDVTMTETAPASHSETARSSTSRGEAASDASSDVTIPSSLLRPLASPSHSFPLSKTPSYTSGTRSAQESRATTPEIHHVTDFSPSRRFLEMSGVHRSSQESSPHRRAPSPKHRTAEERQMPFSSARPASAVASGLVTSVASTTAPTTTTTTSAGVSKAASRPRTLTKSLSVDSQPTWMAKPSVPRSYSATTTPTQLGPPPPGMSEPEAGSYTLPRRRIGGLSPRTARKKFFEESPPEKTGFLSWPERGGGKTKNQVGGGGGGGSQRSLLLVQGVDPGEVRRGAEEEHEWLLSRVVEVPPHLPHSMKTSVSWHEKMHHKTVRSPTETTLPIPLPREEGKPSETTTTTPGPSGEDHRGLSQEAQSKGKGSAKDRRWFFKKSASLDAEVGACIAHAGVTTLAPPAVPSFSPSGFLATIKGKLAPAFGRKSKEEPRTPPPCPPYPTSPLFIPTTVPDIPLRPPSSTSTSTTTTAVAAEEREGGGEDSRLAQHFGGEDSRGRGSSRRQDVPRDSRADARDIRWRSMSADRATRPLLVHTDVIVPAQIWQFSETAV
ncbi:hypothetical protein ACOMHN_043730 [Nucella lapillus]